MHRTIVHSARRSLFTAFSFPGSVKKSRDGPDVSALFHSFSGSPPKGPIRFGYGGESVIRSLGCQIVNALQLGDRSQASSLLSEIAGACHTSNVEDIVCILDYCARSPDPLFVMETWRFLEEKNVNLSLRCYMLIIRALGNGGYLDEAVQLVKFLGENRRISFILPLYNCILSICARMKDVLHVDQCLDMMDYHLLGKNEVTYTALLKVAVWQKNLSAVHEIWKEYSKCYNVNIISLRRFIWSFARLGDLESAYDRLQQLITLSHEENTSLYQTVGKIRCKHLDIPIPSNERSVVGSHLCISGHGNPTSVGDSKLTVETGEALLYGQLYEDISTPGEFDFRRPEECRDMSIKKIVRWSFNDVIHACARVRNAELAEQLIAQMQNLGLEPSSSTYDGFVRAVIPSRGVEDSMEVLKVMQERNLKPQDSTLSTLSIWCSRALKLDIAETLLNQIRQSPHAHPYNEFFVACDTMDQPERAVKMLAKMRDLGIKPDVHTYELLFSLFGNVNAPYEDGDLLSKADVAKRINTIEMDMVENGIQHSGISMKNLLKALGGEGMTQELLQYLHAAEKQFSFREVLGADIYNTVLHSLVNAKEDHVAIRMFQNMRLVGFQPDATTYTIMIDCCSNLRCFKSACALVSLMVRDGFLPQTVTYTALMKILLDDDAFDEALDLLDQSISVGNEPDVLLFNTILAKASFRGRIDVIELVAEVMHREKIQPDPSTCSYVFEAYVNQDDLGTAIEALEVLSLRMISLEEDTLEDVKTEFGDLIFSENSEAEAQILQMFSNSEILAAALLNLRWCAILGSSVSWAPELSLWAKRLACSYAAQVEDLP